MNTKQIIALAALTVAGSAALAQQPAQVVTVTGSPFHAYVSETEGLVTEAAVAPSTLSRAQVTAAVLEARAAGQYPFVSEVQGYRVAMAADSPDSTLSRADVRAQNTRAARQAFASEFPGG
ncbi:MAG: hypothetical protein KGK09_10500 [Burkholderiales bacterium]|nr:hypothetical protein [Burkholderiales bacterium]